jgi:hypothetical protein
MAGELVADRDERTEVVPGDADTERVAQVLDRPVLGCVDAELVGGEGDGVLIEGLYSGGVVGGSVGLGRGRA